MKFELFHNRINKTLKLLEFNANQKKNSNLIIRRQNYKNHEILRIQRQNNKNHNNYWNSKAELWKS